MRAHQWLELACLFASLGTLLGGLVILLGTRGGRRYLTSDTVPAINASPWVVGLAVVAAFWGHAYPATWVAATALVLSLSVPTVFDFWGIRAKGHLGASLGGACACLGAIPIQLLCLWAWVGMFEEMRWPVSTQPCVGAFVSAGTVGDRLRMLVGIVIEAPIVEEIAMTGMLYPWLKGRVGRSWACLFTALVFSLLHCHPVGIPKFFLHSLVATWLFETTRSLLPAMFMHFTGNAIVALLLWLEYPCEMA